MSNNRIRDEKLYAAKCDAFIEQLRQEEPFSETAVELLRDADAVYPDEARSIGYGDVVEVVARIMVGLDGSVESVTILSNPPKLGFREAANEALYAMRFAPIYYQGVNIRVPFEKHLIFQP